MIPAQHQPISLSKDEAESMTVVHHSLRSCLSQSLFLRKTLLYKRSGPRPTAAAAAPRLLPSLTATPLDVHPEQEMKTR